tara:strand:- start:835 stop:1056 length:222 start_codon:yes stop_codon:yes gene_type:complete
MSSDPSAICVDGFCANHFKTDVTLVAVCFILLVCLVWVLVGVFKIIKFKNKAILGMIFILCLEQMSKMLFYAV